MLKRHHSILLLLLLVQAVELIRSASSAGCPIRSLQFRRYSFRPTCPDSKSLRIADERDCALAASTSAAESAAVMTQSAGDTCHVIAALCPRYQLCSTNCTVLMPVGLTALEHVVMSVKSGCGHKVWDVLNGLPPHPDYVVQPAHPDAATLPDTFRSSLLDDMQRLISGLIYKQFIVQLYKNSSVVVRLVFDVGSTASTVNKLNWFRKERLVQNWPVTTNLTSMDTNFFSIEGDNGGIKLRRFFINFQYLGCDSDRGFMVVLDTADDVCSLYRFTQAVPRIVYSSDPTLSMQSTIQDAEYIAVLVR